MSIKYIPFAPIHYDGLKTVDNKIFTVKFNLGDKVDIVLYRNTTEINRVNKSDFLIKVKTITGVFKEECSIVTPSFVAELDETPFNYVYIPIYNRYYFVNNIINVNKTLKRVELNCDVLHTYRREILKLHGFIGRQENTYNNMLVDGNLPTQNNPVVETIVIPNTVFDTYTREQSYNFLLSVIK